MTHRIFSYLFAKHPETNRLVAPVLRNGKSVNQDRGVRHGAAAENHGGNQERYQHRRQVRRWCWHWRDLAGFIEIYGDSRCFDWHLDSAQVGLMEIFKDISWHHWWLSPFFGFQAGKHWDSWGPTSKIVCFFPFQVRDICVSPKKNSWMDRKWIGHAARWDVSAVPQYHIHWL